MKDIEPKNSKDQYHGYQEWYQEYSYALWYRGKWKNGLAIGYEEFHGIRTTKYYII